MQARTAREVGAVIRERRRSMRWTQAQLAEAAGVARVWVIGIERGKATAELALVLRTLAALDLVADIVPGTKAAGAIDLDELLR